MIFERVFPGEKTITSHSVLITFFFPATVENIHSCKKGCRYFWNHWFCFAKPIFGNLFAKERHVYFHHTDLHFDCPASDWKRNGLWKETFMDTCCANRIKIFVRFATTIFVQTLLPHESRCFQVTLVAFGSQLVAFGPHHIPPTLLTMWFCSSQQRLHAVRKAEVPIFPLAPMWLHATSGEHHTTQPNTAHKEHGQTQSHHGNGASKAKLAHKQHVNVAMLLAKLS